MTEPFQKAYDFQVVANDAPRRLVTAWAYQTVLKDGTRVVDHSGEFIESADLETAALEFMRASREASDDHGPDQAGEVLESLVFTKEKLEALGVAGKLPEGWLVTVRLDPETFGKVESGERLMLSIEGKAQRLEVSE